MEDKQIKNKKVERRYLDKDDAYRTLELTNSWISNVDAKISFALALAGVLSALIFSGELPLAIQNVVNKGKWSLVTGGDIIAVIMVIFLYLVSLSSILLLLLGMVARVKTDGDSLFFFGTISMRKLEDYRKKMLYLEDEHIMKDLIEQIHTNSRICKKKMWFYNKGLHVLIGAVVIWFLCMAFQLI